MSHAFLIEKQQTSKKASEHHAGLPHTMHLPHQSWQAMATAAWWLAHGIIMCGGHGRDLNCHLGTTICFWLLGFTMIYRCCFVEEWAIFNWARGLISGSMVPLTLPDDGIFCPCKWLFHTAGSFSLFNPHFLGTKRG